MGYLDDEVKRLQSIIDALDGRVKALESRQLTGQSKPATREELRMILIGPPGAGTFWFQSSKKTSKIQTRTVSGPTILRASLTPRKHVGKGTQAPKIKEKFNCCHLVSQLTSPSSSFLPSTSTLSR